MVRKRSWPAVSQICSLTRLPSSSMVLILKSMPMVVMNDGVKESSLKRNRQQDLPTPESPMSSSLICPGGGGVVSLRWFSSGVACDGACGWSSPARSRSLGAACVYV